MFQLFTVFESVIQYTKSVIGYTLGVIEYTLCVK
jgi:hypothetical protein